MNWEGAGRMDPRMQAEPEVFNWFTVHEDIHLTCGADEINVEEPPSRAYLEGEGRSGPLTLCHVPSETCHAGYAVKSDVMWKDGIHAFIVSGNGVGGYLGVGADPVATKHYIWSAWNKERCAYVACPTNEGEYLYLEIDLIRNTLRTGSIDYEKMKLKSTLTSKRLPDVSTKGWHAVTGLHHVATVRIHGRLAPLVWTIEEHSNCPHMFQLLVWTLFLAQLNGTLSVLPKEILYIVLQLVDPLDYSRQVSTGRFDDITSEASSTSIRKAITGKGVRKCSIQ